MFLIIQASIDIYPEPFFLNYVEELTDEIKQAAFDQRIMVVDVEEMVKINRESWCESMGDWSPILPHWKEFTPVDEDGKPIKTLF
jgi:hypothetical protein